ncbi:hypothetical protein QQ045_019348 [Rhodiola kirilowii]
MAVVESLRMWNHNSLQILRSTRTCGMRDFARELHRRKRIPLLSSDWSSRTAHLPFRFEVTEIGLICIYGKGFCNVNTWIKSVIFHPVRHTFQEAG